MSISHNFFGVSREMKSLFIQAFDQQLWTVSQVCSCVGGLPTGDIDPSHKLSMICCFDGVLLKNSLYVHYDYEDDSLAVNAMKRGAYAILSSKKIGQFPCILVEDVLSSMRKIAELMWQRINIPATVITGSVGKTTTKNFVDCVYSTHYRTFCNPTNGNTFEYMGYELQRFDKKAERFVQEVNESDPFNARNCSLVLHPKIALITNMDRSHIGELGSEENIMKAICQITDGMGEDDHVIINADDPNSNKVSFRQKVISVGIDNLSADCIAKNIVETPLKTDFDLCYNSEVIHISLPVSGKHNLYNAMMAFIAGRLSDIPTHKIVSGLQKYQQLGFRQHLFRSGAYTVYADCYNASARSIKSALAVLDTIDAPGEKVAVLGDIAEIEGFEQETYRNVAASVDESTASVLVTFGPESGRINTNLKRPIPSFHANNRSELNLIRRS